MREGGMSPDTEAPALVVFVGPMGESSARVHVLTEADGLVRGVAYGGASRAGRGVWQLGNVVKTRMQRRGDASPCRLSGEVLYGCAARLFSAPLAMAMVVSTCALADATLPEREPCPALFGETVRLLTFLGYDPGVAEREGMPHYIRWELSLLRTLGFGLDLDMCALTGLREGLAYVSPRTGRAVNVDAAGPWKERLLPLPSFLRDTDETGTPHDWALGLRLSGHFLARDAFGQRHLPMPAARQRLVERVENLTAGPNPNGAHEPPDETDGPKPEGDTP
ncbi:DNA repair protein RecO [Acetobacter sp. TBRC 12305]|uniref:DNA repair protein RecO n=1 Tax=Acetobacter garciniae TaxID=2817435 RepID=A0A939HRI1_9PROT|nr:DNA repair protein RecO [Acetobacter garciniae]MBO1326599.1 DNA repair protein RecO [Acetobacter garciniae]MBX0346299.1 DNA repair protein RecO [Acetobacter garciniae]